MPHLSCGIIGLPNVGKSTLFNALTSAGAEVAAYPFCTIDPNIGVVPVRDKRVDDVAGLVHADRIIYHTVKCVDVAGLVKNASKGAGRGNQFLENVRDCDALIQVVRCFDAPNVAHVHSSIDPVEDIRTVSLELILADLQTAQRALERVTKQARRDPGLRASAVILEKACEHLDNEKPVRSLPVSDEESEIVHSFSFLTSKRVLYAANINEEDLPGTDNDRVKAVVDLAESEDNAVIPVCAKIEEEIVRLETDEARLFLEDLGLQEPGLQRLVRAACELLGLICFLTFNESEARAWTVRRGATAVEAAGIIHTDFAEHFIRAEVTSFDDFKRAGGEKGAREEGLMRIEGRDYVVQDGDVIYFRVGP